MSCPCRYIVNGTDSWENVLPGFENHYLIQRSCSREVRTYAFIVSFHLPRSHKRNSQPSRWNYPPWPSVQEEGKNLWQNSVGCLRCNGDIRCMDLKWRVLYGLVLRANCVLHILCISKLCGKLKYLHTWVHSPQTPLSTIYQHTAVRVCLCSG